MLSLRSVPYLSKFSCVPTIPLIPFRTSEAPPVYQPCPPSRFVPQKPLPCTNRAPDPVPYLRSLSRVPTVPLIPFRTSEAPPVYQPCSSHRSVPQKLLPCTNYAPDPVPYLRSLSCVPTMPLAPFRTSEAPPCVPTVSSPRFVPRSTFFEPNSAHNIWADDSHLFLSALNGNNESTSYCVKPSVRRICPLDER